MELLQEFKGETKSNKIIDNCYHIYKELFVKQFPDYFEKNHSKMFSLITITEDNEIKNIGMSKIEDLLMDNWGEFFGALLGGVSASMRRTSDGNTDTLNIYGGDQTRLFNITNNGGVGSIIRVGTGVTPATRQDFKIENLQQTLTSGNGGYNSGLGKIDIPANGTALSGFSITETVLEGIWVDSFQGVDAYLLSHDVFNPISVIIAQTINVDYELILS